MDVEVYLEEVRGKEKIRLSFCSFSSFSTNKQIQLLAISSYQFLKFPIRKNIFFSDAPVAGKCQINVNHRSGQRVRVKLC